MSANTHPMTGLPPALLVAQESKYRAMANTLPPGSAAHRAAKATADLTNQTMQAPPYNCTITPPAEQEARSSRLSKAVDWLRGIATPPGNG